MKKFFKITITLFCIFCLVFFTIPVNAINTQNEKNCSDEFVQIFPSNISENVCVYKNNNTGEKYATFNPSDFNEGDTIVLYNNQETGEKVKITIVSQETTNNQRGSYDSGWSGGYIPSGFKTYRAEMDTLLIDITYDVDVTAYPVKMISAYNTTFSSLIHHLDSINTYIGRSSATNSAPAYATCEYVIATEQAGIIGGSFAGYLTLQINYLGQCRAQWAY